MDRATFENPLSDNETDTGSIDTNPAAIFESPFQSVDGETATIHQVRSVFQRMANDEGNVDRPGLTKVMRALSLPSATEQIEEFFTEIAGASAPSVSFEQFVPWFQAKQGAFKQPSKGEPLSPNFRQAGTGAKSVGKKVLKPASKLKKAIMGDADERLVRGVAPESMFLIDHHGNTDMRELADLRGQVHVCYESDFHHLRDLIISHEDLVFYQEAFDEANDELFDEESAEQALGWPAECIQAAKQVFRRREQLHLWRHFVQSDPQLGTDTAGMLLYWPNRDNQESAQTPHAAELAAREFLISGNSVLEDVMNKETLPFERAFQVVRGALQQELTLRKLKVSELEQRLDGMTEYSKRSYETTALSRKLRFSGLRGEAAAANGTYCIEGLRLYWGRPLYARLSESGADSTAPYFLYFTKTYQPAETLADGTESPGRWSNGTWVLGPTLNSERCTAYLEESADHEMLYPASTAALATHKEKYSLKKWHVFDVVAKSWSDAPGHHCPSFSVVPIEEPGNSLADYVEAAIEQQKQSTQQFERIVNVEEEQETLRLTLKGHVDAGGNISRGAFLSWRKTLYKDELWDKQRKLGAVILSDQALSLNGTADERKQTVDEVISSFIWQVQKELSIRQVAKRKFFTRISRPALSRAFFTWKFACRQSSVASMPTSGIFAEPQLPWNVRHPRSRFTSLWEIVQSVILIYVAFSVVWRTCFNSPAEGAVAVVEILIDLFFAVDIVLNLHSAYYDKSGDLIGLAPSGRTKVGWQILSCGSGADLRSTYTNYVRGWFVIDFVSVFPFDWAAEQLFGHGDAKSGADAQFVRVLRLVRLTKLLRLARGMRIFKKHEEELGPIFSAILLVGMVALMLHLIACGWFLVGTSRSFHYDHECTSDECEDVVVPESSGWLEMHFGLSESMCGCHSDENGNAFFYDAYEDICLHPLNLSAPVEPVCDGVMRPDVWTYYNTALYKAMQDTPIGDGYLHSTHELWAAAFITALFGFLWGAVAGAWSTIFAANALAGQEYRMKMLQIKEFCRLKSLDWGARAKLLAYYEQLYPEGVIIDEQEIMNDLPPAMKIELVKQIYGGIILAVPLFFGLDTTILTEICLALVPLPVMKGEVVLREGDKGAEMYCIHTGQCRVTQHMSIGEDEERVRTWIEETFGAHGKILRLYEPNQRKLLQKLLKRIQSRAWAKQLKSRSLSAVKSNRSFDFSGGGQATVTYRELLHDDSLMSSFTADRSVVDPAATLQTLLATAKKHKCVNYQGPLVLSRMSDGSYDSGPEITLEQVTTAHIAWESARQMLCSALCDGTVLCNLLNFFIGFPKVDVQRESGALQLITGLASDAASIGDGLVTGTASVTLKAADKGVSLVPGAMGRDQLQKGVSGINKIQEHTVGRATQVASSVATSLDHLSVGAKRNITNFLDALSDSDRQFNTGELIVQTMNASGNPGQHLFTVQDLMLFDQGSPQEQAQKQTRVVSCLLEFAAAVSSLEGYMGIKLVR